MSESSFQFDDELLSAYLDGQLTDDELREVESWLARDEAARTTLEELRSVSQEVQALPRQSVPSEWTTALAARLDEAAQRKDDSPPSSGGVSLPVIPFGRSLRGLWWSAAAIAAAIAIMVAMPQDEPPQVVMSGGLKSPKMANGAEIAADSASEPAMEDSDSDVPTFESAAPVERMAEAAVAPSDSPVRSLPAGNGPTLYRGLETDAVRMADRAISNEPYLVVWAEVPPQTLKQNHMNEVLGANGIQVQLKAESWDTAAEPLRQVRQQIERRNAGTRDDSLTLGGIAGEVADEVPTSRFPTPEESNRSTREESAPASIAASSTPLDTRGTDDQEQADLKVAEQTPTEPEGETILVEATAGQIMGCLSAMEMDPDNFAEITVESIGNLSMVNSLRSGESLGFGGFGTSRRMLGVERGSSSANESDSGVLAQQPLESEAMSRAQRVETPDNTQVESLPNLVNNKLPEGNARRLKQTKGWYFQNSAPVNADNAYQLREPTMAKMSKAEVNQFEQRQDLRQQQLAEFNMRLNSLDPAGNTSNLIEPLHEAQPVQVLFVLRNRYLPETASPAAEPPPAAEAESSESP
ncbi:anti-sigma factor family protein [Aeoliella mucimassa]|uniref:Zinc-finger domain-containing protein n=1 Tax=Aeoliella mucimassa TaxID=2527972 RepID=A0A518AHV5_9BACT|nr:hypothetical protein [Aeoliella mucimassa]QDU54302.1 hypothetical protein Pan181_04830 [Aeoliella mucimassa]